MKSIEITKELVNGFCSLVNDPNPIHKGDKAIAPGMLVASLLTSDHTTKAIIRSVDIKFSLPIYVGERVDIEEQVVDTRSVGNGNLYTIQYTFRVSGERRQVATMKVYNAV